MRLLAFLAFPALIATAQISDEARRLHQDAFVFDGHIHVINRQFHDGTDIGQRLKGGQMDLPRAKAGGVDAMFFSLFIPEQYYPPRFETQHALRLMDKALEQIRRNEDKIAIARKAADLDRIRRTGKIAAVLDLEGGFNLDGDVRVLQRLYNMGLRSAQLPAHNWANHFADSCCAKHQWNGLNARGAEVVAEMNRLGMIINVSHASDETIEQVLKISVDPILATHHGMRALNDIPRNMPDALMKKLAEKGGVIGFHIGNEFHNRPMFDWRTKQAGKPFWDTSAIGEKERKLTIEDIDRRVAPTFPMMGTNAPDDILMTPEEWIGVIERAISVVGEDHVMLGSDWDGGPTPPRGMKDIADMPRLTQAMLNRHWSETRIRKFLGGNLERVFRQVCKK
ncbi:MAG: membrane dipeptidase [Bryobacterales bacterium]|nr:membrane dipeptidase [Bryobacterales bacterium]